MRAGTIDSSRMPFLWMFSDTGNTATWALLVRMTMADTSSFRSSIFSSTQAWPPRSA
ncbi:hypothetical protein D3C84_1190020 [compost metagenome]